MTKAKLRFAVIQYEQTLPLNELRRYQARRREFARLQGCGYYELELMEGLSPDIVAAYIGDLSAPRPPKRYPDHRKKRPERYKRNRPTLSIKDL